MAFNTKTDFSRQIIQHENTTAILSGNTSVLGDFYIKNIELTPEDITIGETLVYDGVRLKPGSTSSYQDRVIVGMGLSVDPTNALIYNVNLGQYTIGNTQYFYSGGTVSITNGDPLLSRFDIIYITSSNTASVLMGTSSNSPITPTLSSGQLSLGIILVPAGYYSGSTGTTVFTPTSSDTIFRYHNGYTSAIERSDGNSDALANFAMALSRDSRVTGQDGVALGLGTKANTNFQTSLGKYNEFDTDALLIVGYGDDDLNRANALTVDFSGNTKIHEKFYINDIQIDTGIPNNGDILRYNGNKFAPETLVWNIELPYYSFSGLTSYTTNATYKVTGVHPELYGGTDIFIKTDDFGNLDTERAVGKFYNPKYNQNVVGFGVWNKYSKWNFNSIVGNFNTSEIVTSNNGSTAQLYNGIYSGLFIPISGNWSGSTAITGNTTFSKCNITSISLANYSANSKTIWGGYVWQNLTGGTGNNIDVINLNNVDWVKVPYSSSSDYNVAYDEISFDITNNWIYRRYEDNSENEIIETKLDYDFFNFTYPSISVFMWGNKYNSTLEVGLKLNKIHNSYFESVDFRGGTLYSNELKNNSYIKDNVIIGQYITINNNILNSTNSKISENILLNYSSSLYKNKLDGIGNKISNNFIIYNSTIHDNYINCSNGYIQSNNIINVSNVRDNVLNGSNSILQNNNLYNSEIKENELNGITYIDTNTINDSSINYNKLIGANLGIGYNTIRNSSHIDSNYINGSNSYIQLNAITGSSINNNTINGYQNEIRGNILKNNNAIRYNIIFNSENTIRENVFNSTNCFIENNTFSSESEIWGNIINGGNIANNNLIENCTISYNTKTNDIKYNTLEINSSINYNGISSVFSDNKLTNNSNIGNSVFNDNFNNNNLFNTQIQNIIGFNYAITNSQFINYEYLTPPISSHNKSFFISNLPTSSTLDNIYIKQDNQIKEISLIDFNNLLNINISGSTFNPNIDNIGDISANTNTILDNDTVNAAFGKTQGQINNIKNDLINYIPVSGTTILSGDIFRTGNGESYFGVKNGSNSSWIDSYVDGSIRILESLVVTGGNSYAGTFATSGTDLATWNASVQGITGDKNFSFSLNQAFLLDGAEIAYNADRTTEINANPLALINRAYADLRYSGLTGYSGLTVTGDVTGSTTNNNLILTLNNITTGQTVGSSTQIPIITYDNKGRITSASTISISIPTQGITTINNQTGTTQTLITGNTGNDFNIVSNGGIHTFNIPTASSGITRGLLTSSDWVNFNNKQTPLIFSSGLTNTSGVITNNLLLGISGGQTIIGSTSTNSGITYRTTSGIGSTGADHIFQVGNNGGTEAFRILNSANVGIRNSTPQHFLDVASNSNSSGIRSINTVLGNSASLTLHSVLPAATMMGRIDFGAASSTTTGYISARISANAMENHTAGSVQGTDLIFSTTNSFTATLSDRMIIRHNGFIGIGNMSPTAALSLSPNGTNLTGTALSTTLTSNSGGITNNLGNILRLANFGHTTSGGNHVSLGIISQRTAFSTDGNNNSIGLQYTVDNTAGLNSAELWIASNGCIGFGVSAPTSKLQIAAGSATISGIRLTNQAAYTSAVVGSISLENTNDFSFVGNVTSKRGAVAAFGTSDNFALNLVTNNSSRVTIGTTGIVTLTASIIGIASQDIFNTVSTTVNAFGAATTATIFGTSTAAVTYNIGNNATAASITKTISIGTGGSSGSTTNINLGSATSGATSLITVNGALKLPVYTVATLPTVNAGTMVYVSDASTPTYNATVTGGGAVGIPVVYNGTTWTCH